LLKKFQRKIEDFVCDNCGATVKGTGYTNHCPKCLYSKHVDINPGDRASDCGGLMSPVEIELSHGKYIIIHRCGKCGYQKKNKSQKDDNLDLIIKIASRK
jgi:rubrerythrin